LRLLTFSPTRLRTLASVANCAMLRAALKEKILNIAAYKFVALPELRALRSRLLALCKSWELKGTILLSAEGINLFVAGDRGKIDLLFAELRSLPGWRICRRNQRDGTSPVYEDAGAHQKRNHRVRLLRH